MSAPPAPVAVPKAAPQNHHLGSAGHFEDVDVGELIDKSDCATIYYALEECLGEHDRDWRKCQTEVKNLRNCNDLARQRHQKEENVQHGASDA